MLAQEDRILRPIPADHQRADRIILPVHFLEDMAGAMGDRLDCGQILQRQIIGRRGESQAGDRPLQRRIGAGGPVAVEIGLNMEMPGQLPRTGEPLPQGQRVEPGIETESSPSRPA